VVPNDGITSGTHDLAELTALFFVHPNLFPGVHLSQNMLYNLGFSVLNQNLMTRTTLVGKKLDLLFSLPWESVLAKVLILDSFPQTTTAIQLSCIKLEVILLATHSNPWITFVKLTLNTLRPVF